MAPKALSPNSLSHRNRKGEDPPGSFLATLPKREGKVFIRPLLLYDGPLLRQPMERCDHERALARKPFPIGKGEPEPRISFLFQGVWRICGPSEISPRTTNADVIGEQNAAFEGRMVGCDQYAGTDLGSRSVENCMAANDYQFVTEWKVEGTANEVYGVLSDAESLPRWWPAVYFDVQKFRDCLAGSGGVGAEFALTTKGWLPYILRWRFRVTEVVPDERLELEAFGDFRGSGVWTIAEENGFCNVRYDWKVRAAKPLLKYLSPILKPIFAMNHQWAMKTGEASLKAELMRRRARSWAELRSVPQPPVSSRSEYALSAVLILIIFGLISVCLTRGIQRG